MIPIPLRTKLILSHTLPVLILVPLLVVYLFSTMRDFYHERLDHDLTRAGIILAEVIHTDPGIANDPVRLQQLMDRLHTQTDAHIQLLDPAGNSIASTDPIPARKLLANASAQSTSITNPNDFVTVFVPVDANDSIAQIRLSLQVSDVTLTFNRLLWLIIGVVLALALVTWVVGYALSIRITQPLVKLGDEMKAVAVGDLSQRLNVSSHDEVEELAASFNRLVDQLAEHRAAREHLLDDLSHELRRPLAALQAAVQVLRDDRPKSSETITRLMEGIQWEVGRLGRLTNRLTYAARDEHMPHPLALTSVDLAEIVTRVVVLFQAEAMHRGIDLVSDLPSLPTIQADDDALEEVLTNLVDNALKFTPRGGRVCVSAGADDERVWVQVADTGIGLTPEQQKLVFNRYYCGTPTHRRAQGLGLGLAISNELVQAHHGSIHLESALNQGTRFTVELPRP